jgi:tetratricopeptide (TPR) repeat protein
VQREAAERLQRFPDSPHTVGWLARAKRIGDALAVLERVAERQPGRLDDAVKGLEIVEIQRDQSQGHRTRLRAVLATAQRRLPTLDRERAAAVAIALLPIEAATVDPGGDPGDWEVRLARLAKEYAGTEAVRLAEIDLVTRPRLTLAGLDVLERIAADAPGTAVAAKARYTKAFHLARNWNNLVLAGANPDPTDAFFEVLAIVADLESGRYPPCPWVEQAPELVTGYFMFEPKLTAQSAARMLEGVRQFVRTHPALFTHPLPMRRLDGLVTRFVPIVASFLPDGLTVVQQQFAELERIAPDPAAARLLHATWLDTGQNAFIGDVVLAPRTATHEAEVRALLSAAATSTDTRVARAALARLAEREFADPESLAAARRHFVEYRQRFATAPDAWVPAIRLGQVAQAEGQREAAVAAFVSAADAHPEDAFVRALALAYAGKVSEESGAFAAAARHYRTALDTWTAELSDTLSLDLPLPPNRAPEFPANPLTVNRALVRRATVEQRVAEIGRTLGQPGAVDLERGRWLFGEGRSGEAVEVLDDVARRFAGSAVGREAHTTLRRARLEAAVARAGAGAAAADVTAALSDLEALAREPFDATSGTAGVVAATLRYLTGPPDDAERVLTAALTRWVREGTSSAPAPAAGTLEAEVLAVRDAVFLPLGNALLGSQWNLAEWPAALPRYVVALGTLSVTTADGTARDVRVARPPATLSNVVFMTRDEVRYLTSTISQMGGTARRTSTSVMQVPNQPVGGSRSIVEWWNRFFPARPGHWGGFEILTYPAFSSIEFTDAARTRALVPITVGYSGATVVLQKRDGVWTMRELVNFWIT